MLDLLFALLLVCLNLSTFLLMSVNLKIKVKVDKKKLGMFFILLLIIVIAFIIFNPERYLASFYMSAALIALFGIRFLIYKFLSPPPETEDKRRQVARNIFDSVFFPLFVIFFSFAQCMSLLVWNS
jgi:hypothetical protein